MHILILGSGGREHALAWKIAQSPLCGTLFIAPGNAGTLEFGHNLDIPLNDFHKISQAVLDHQIGLVVVGPEQPLVDGIVDFFAQDIRLKHVLIFGPNRHGAALEGSKDFAKAFMQRHGIPTASYKSFTESTYKEGVEYLASIPGPYVLKADGLAAGKGVIISEDLRVAQQSLEDILVKHRFGEAGTTVVIEEFLPGIELSAFVITDGKNYRMLPQAKDYKRIGEGDTGPNTGGMGTISPVPFADETFMSKVEKRIIQPTINGLQKDGVDYRGVIFFGLMNVAGNPFVIEYNVRLGDPEAESILPRISSDLVPILVAAAQGDMGQHDIHEDDRTAVTIILASGGYPGLFEKGKPITGIGDILNSFAFQSGTVMDQEGETLTAGGRVIALTSLGKSLNEALQFVYADATKISFENIYYRKDIGQDLLPYLAHKPDQTKLSI